MIRVRIFCFSQDSMDHALNYLNPLGLQPKVENRQLLLEFDDNDPLIGPIVTALTYKLSEKPRGVTAVYVNRVDDCGFGEFLAQIHNFENN